MESEFGGAVALVTGAAGAGIGQAIARRLATGGANVVVTDIHERRTKEVAAAIQAAHPNVRVAGFPLDASDRSGIEDWGWGAALHFNSVYTLGVASHSGDPGFFVSTDLLKLFQSQEKTLGKFGR